MRVDRIKCTNPKVLNMHNFQTVQNSLVNNSVSFGKKLNISNTNLKLQAQNVFVQIANQFQYLGKLFSKFERTPVEKPVKKIPNKKLKYMSSKNHTITKEFTPENVLLNRLEEDEFGRFFDLKKYDSEGNVILHQHKNYYSRKDDSGNIETFVTSDEKYIRQFHTVKIGNNNHFIDDFTNVLNPENSYINEYIRNSYGRLIRIISNGREVKFSQKECY